MYQARLEPVSECLYRSHLAAYFAFVKVAGKQIKRSVRTIDRQMAKRLPVRFRKKAACLV
jgi:hypothetical protein